MTFQFPLSIILVLTLLSKLFLFYSFALFLLRRKLLILFKHCTSNFFWVFSVSLSTRFSLSGICGGVTILPLPILSFFTAPFLYSFYTSPLFLLYESFAPSTRVLYAFYISPSFLLHEPFTPSTWILYSFYMSPLLLLHEFYTNPLFLLHESFTPST